jgi:hypothetical protein
MHPESEAPLRHSKGPRGRNTAPTAMYLTSTVRYLARCLVVSLVSQTHTQFCDRTQRPCLPCLGPGINLWIYA